VAVRTVEARQRRLPGRARPVVHNGPV